MDDHRLTSEYFKKCFFSVDGLWFLKLEESASFEKALEIDIAVWKVLPKIEARTIKNLLCLSSGIDGLQQAFSFKLKAEEYDYKILPARGGFSIEIYSCPWVHHITKAGRQHLMQQIADAICPVEYETFAREFGAAISFTHEQKGCLEKHHCVFTFSQDEGLQSGEGGKGDVRSET